MSLGGLLKKGKTAKIKKVYGFLRNMTGRGRLGEGMRTHWEKSAHSAAVR